ncbi:hypothetical protein B0H15DRAFT_825109 [Mycena belliarum]|uniref:BTB domain-containing protein n=1 Tax=Mycena belliarum TaxID=1033014 RepID=A0AAD6UE06_9AGAR|nr:hypothetical protein B0H15DRAFT_825109 [Mycena belliae]
MSLHRSFSQTTMADTGITDASHPFSPTSDELNPPDVIIRSSDMVDFHVHKAILSFGSVVFKDMFSFPEPTGEQANPKRDGKSVVELTEKSESLKQLLILCYPRITGSSILRQLDGIDGAYEAAGKYQIPGAQHILTQALLDPLVLENEPHRVFAIACHCGLKTVAKTAAIATLKLPSHIAHLPSIPEFRLISAYHLWQLNDFYRLCSEALPALLDELLRPVHLGDDPVDSPAQIWWQMKGHSETCGPSEEPGAYLHSSKWFKDHVRRVKVASVLRPHPGSLSDAMNDISGPTWKAMAGCRRCMLCARDHLRGVGIQLHDKVTEAHAEILNKFSFAD